VAGSVYAPVAKTGQTIPYRTDDDGTLKAGVTPPAPRFTAGSGDATNTVTDNLTGLTWCRNGNQPAATKDWNSAIDYCNSFTNGGYSDWRLPNIREVFSLFDFSAQTGTKLPSSNLFSNVQPSPYWTSTTSADDTNSAYELHMGSVALPMRPQSKGNSKYVWPVRGPQ